MSRSPSAMSRAVDLVRVTRPLDAVAVFDLPLKVDGITVSQMWHSRLDADVGHRWLRDLVLQAAAG